MRRPGIVNMTEAGEMLGLGRQTISDIVDRMGIPVVRSGVAGRGRWITVKNVHKIARKLGIDVREPIPA